MRLGLWLGLGLESSKAPSKGLVCPRESLNLRRGLGLGLGLGCH